MTTLHDLPYGANSIGLKLDPRELLEVHGRSIDFGVLDGFAGRSIIDAASLTREEIVELAKLAALLESTRIEMRKPLDGKIIITAFFEPSTRTRLSFESAIERLDGKVLSVPDGQNTGAAKGESLADIGEMFNTYGDAVVMRHTETGSCDKIRTNLTLPLINAGNGSGHHPSQGLLDWYALFKWRPTLSLGGGEDEKLHIAIVGTPGNMRAVKSFLHVTLKFPDVVSRVTVVSEMADPFGSTLRPEVEASTVPVTVSHDLSEHLGDVDVIYMNSIALLGDSYKQLDSKFRLTSASGLSPRTVVMHPLARRGELDVSLDATDHNLYFAQAAGAVFSRQALLVSVFGRAEWLEDLLAT
jgi:aspartate carbamoyltransferase catalytic subunit